MKINRLIEIVVLLLNRERLTAKDLAGRFEVSLRTIYRDIEALSSAGVPVYMSKGHGGGISLLPGYSLNKTLFSQEDKESLMLALNTLQVTRHPEVDSALEKVRSLFTDTRLEDWVQVDLTEWGSSPNEAERFTRIKEAILKRQVIVFSYVNSSGVRSKRSVEPLRLIFKGRAWYLHGYCRLKQEFRVFRISRVKELEVSSERFERRVDPTPASTEAPESSRNGVKFRLRFKPDIMSRVYDDFPEEQISRNGTSGCDVTFSFPEDEWVYGYILSFGPYVEVLEPLYVREYVISRLRKALAIYE